MSDVFAGYPRGAAWDEVIDDTGAVRPSYRHVHQALAQMSEAELRARAESLARGYLTQGVTFDIGGEERPFPIDVAPRVVTEAEWDGVAPGVAQRVKALEAFLADVYGDQRAVADGVVPRRLVTSSTHFHRAAQGIDPPNGVRVHVAGIDLIRDAGGTFRVLEDNVRVPSGVSYVLSNRRAMAQVFPELFATLRIRPVSDYPRRLLAALVAAAPRGVDDPTVVVLTPGVYNSAYFEHSLLARTMGVELVEGRDLFCSGGRVWMRTTTGPTPGGRDLPPGRRRVPRPGGVPRRLGARLPGRDGLCPHRHGDDRQRGGQRRRRRQARVLLRAGPDQVLPRRGAAARRASTPGGWRSPPRSRRCWTGSRSWWSSRSTARAARAS